MIERWIPAQRSIMNKVATVTFGFWIIKICATTLGETAGDLVSMTMNLGYGTSSLILLTVFAVALFIQLRARAFSPALYWSVILLTSTAGTTISDFMDRTLALGYARGATILAGTLSLILIVWFAVERSLSVSDVTTKRVETFYWTAILVSNTLGTALGDFLADDSGLGFGGSALLIASTIAVIAVLFATTKLNRQLLFWAAFVLTRPFGATLGDLLTKPIAAGGFALGTVGSSSVLLAMLVAMVLYSTLAARKLKSPQITSRVPIRDVRAQEIR